MGYTESLTFRLYAEVVVGSNINKVLDYGVPEKLEHITKGTSVIVSLRGAKKVGIVYQVKATTRCQQVLPILGVPESAIILPQDLLDLLFWMSQYYFAPLGKTLRLFLPSISSNIIQPKQQYRVVLKVSKAKVRELLSELEGTHPSQGSVLKILLKNTSALGLSSLMEKAQVSQSPIHSLEKLGIVDIVDAGQLELQEDLLTFFLPELKELHPQQEEALNKISYSLQTSQFHTHLLFGITGSGKTEIYLRATTEALKQGKSTILLVPEIALTVQTVTLFKARFGKKVGVLHHKLSDSDKSRTWLRASEGSLRILIGPRSALFCPMKNLGLIIVDEEHDPAYKQTESPPCYHARDVAVMRGKLNRATVILGSATPSLESYTNALSGKYILSHLSSRAGAAYPPKVSLIDMNLEREKSKAKTLFSQPALQKINERLQVGEQVLVFFNRRGYHTNVSCKVCKHTLKCPRCDMVLTFHKYANVLLCHLCNSSPKDLPQSCPKCLGTMTLQYRGSGTEKIEKVLQQIFPQIRTLRIDSDTTKLKGSHEALLKQFATGKADVLIGTQMIAKGMHFSAVTLAIILNGDSGLYIPDFRASEQVFQLITQVAGRSGRSYLPGEVLIQSFLPDHPTIHCAMREDYSAFYNQEISGREVCDYPPFVRLVRCIFMGKCPKQTWKEANRVYINLKEHLENTSQLMQVTPCGHFKVKDIFRYQFLIKSTHIISVNKKLHHALMLAKLSPKVKFMIDVDPTTTFF
ncbi:Primosomal protein N',primosome assembly protein PriA,ATP-dependent protease HslVU (ClpYQ), peptidase subunit,primosomal protein N',Type III restriction enzyme, res subunit [Chlamydia serpentis]|uniref:Replication restart protein PriA n=1 Tax=Chlamydia serpentis TaxID=1967782 RepID=A0A2R8FC91_9CHLA|nr:primosomal protein N' [Chlamydia serpentis]SPN74034.1 Primosomal protein N',primosome assembly protein PriA,ATP-dependent protease HslVU (ClpYQ), peptidase subunit,primosomal protein N',Type III restriction enzyme, res subunit [Chlamydia serpentis]